MVGLGLLRVGLRLSRLWVPLWVSLLRRALLRRALLRRALLWILRRAALLRRVAVLLGLGGGSPGGGLVPTPLGRAAPCAHGPNPSGHERELSLPTRSSCSVFLVGADGVHLLCRGGGWVEFQLEPRRKQGPGRFEPDHPFTEAEHLGVIGQDRALHRVQVVGGHGTHALDL